VSLFSTAERIIAPVSTFDGSIIARRTKRLDIRSNYSYDVDAEKSIRREFCSELVRIKHIEHNIQVEAERKRDFEVSYLLPMRDYMISWAECILSLRGQIECVYLQSNHIQFDHIKSRREINRLIELSRMYKIKLTDTVNELRKELFRPANPVPESQVNEYSDIDGSLYHVMRRRDAELNELYKRMQGNTE